MAMEKRQPPSNPTAPLLCSYEGDGTCWGALFTNKSINSGCTFFTYSNRMSLRVFGCVFQKRVAKSINHNCCKASAKFPN